MLEMSYMYELTCSILWAEASIYLSDHNTLKLVTPPIIHVSRPMDQILIVV